MASPPLLLAAVLGTVIVVAALGVISLPGNNAAAAETSNSAGQCVSGQGAVADGGVGASQTGGAPADPLSNETQKSTVAEFLGPTAADGSNPADLAGIWLSAAQVQRAQTIISVGKGANAGAKEMAVGLAVAYIQTKFDQVASVANGLGQGMFLQTADAYPGVSRADPAGSAAAFFSRLARFENSGAFHDEEAFADLAVSMSIQGVGAYTRGDYEKVQTWATALQALLAAGVNPAGPAGTGIDCAGAAGDNGGWDPGNIISDAVFYNSDAMDAAAVRTFINIQNAVCPAGNIWCLRNLRIADPGRPADAYCGAVPAGTNEDAAALIAAYSRACGVNPQVMLTKLQLESQGLTRSAPSARSYDEAWGWNCPDTGPGGSARCDPAAAGFLHQLTGMARSWARMKVDIPAHRYNFAVGTYQVLWNVEESGCGAAPVTIQNVATASLYVYTPYQPNAASIAAYPGAGDKCSSYGNRNFFYQFRQYFGSTGGGTAIAAPAGGGTVGGPILVNGAEITLPAGAGISGLITAPNPTVATAISAGLSYLGTPYSWGGGSPAGPTLGICGPDGAQNDCHIVGFDCSGLMMYMWAQVGISVDHFSQDIWAAGRQIPWDQKLPGDMIGYSGHVAMYVGTFAGVDYMLEAPESGEMLRISPVRDSASEPHYATVSRVWAGTK